MLFDPFKTVIGLDIGDLTVKAAMLKSPRYARAGHMPTLVQAAEAQLPEGAIQDGEILKPEDVLRAVRAVIKEVSGKEKIPWVVCSLPETKTFVTLLSAPGDPSQITRETALNLAKNELPIPLDESYIDWHIVPSFAHEDTKLLLGAVLKKTADAYTYLLNIAGLTPLALEVEAMAITRAVLGRTPPQGPIAIVDIGHTRTTFIMYNAQTLQFSLSWEFSGNLLTARIQEAVQCTREEAERIKTTCGFDFERCVCHRGGASRTCPTKPVLEKSMQELEDSIRQGFLFYQEHFGNEQKVESIILSGGGGQMIFLDTLLSRAFSVPVKRASLHSHLSLSPLLAKKTTHSLIRFATAIGLGLRTIYVPLTDITL